MPPTWCRATPTAARRLRPRPPDGHDPAGERRARAAPRAMAQQLQPGDLGGRALRRLLIVRQQPGAGRHQRHVRRLRPRPPDGHDPSGSASAQAAPRAIATATSPAISADGRFVAFSSDATNLVPGDTNGAADVFVRDRQTGTTRAGERRAQAAPRAMGPATSPAISADGRFVAFSSAATNLVPGDTNGTHDVFVRDRQTGTTRAGQRQLRRRPGQ